jgi:hypothetical protein
LDGISLEELHQFDAALGLARLQRFFPRAHVPPVPWPSVGVPRAAVKRSAVPYVRRSRWSARGRPPVGTLTTAQAVPLARERSSAPDPPTLPFDPRAQSLAHS